MLGTLQTVRGKTTMAESIDTPLTGDIWHLSIEDLLAPLPETIRLGGPGPFVINLSSSSAPISLPAASIAGCEHAQLYQLQRVEERRPRYRLRLGPFATEDEADATLKRVREIYPCALTATADAEDLRAIANLQSKAAPRPSAEKPAAPSIPVLTIVPAPVPVRAIVPPPVIAVAPKVIVPPPVIAVAPKVIVPPPVVAVAPKVIAPPPVVAVAPPIIAPPVLTAAQPPQVPAAKPAAAIAPKVASPPVLTVQPKVPPRARAAPPPREVRELDTPLPDLESTQTVRALTQTELNDDQASRWFVIQLSLSPEAFDPETVPNLDIFNLYRLYSVAGVDQGRIVHALRLGFFSEDIAASAVASYLAAFYDKPVIKRVSSAERQRFAGQQPLEARKDVGATGKQAVIEITDERYVRERRTGQAAAKTTRT
jgi:hypothetical protein